jgi:hypothetical protein
VAAIRQWSRGIKQNRDAKTRRRNATRRNGNEVARGSLCWRRNSALSCSQTSSRQKFKCITIQGDVHAALAARATWQNFDRMFFATIGCEPCSPRRRSCEPMLYALRCICEASQCSGERRIVQKHIQWHQRQCETYMQAVLRSCSCSRCSMPEIQAHLT